MAGMGVYWIGMDHSAETVVVKEGGFTPRDVNCVTLRVSNGNLSIYLTHDQAWHLRDDLNTVLADGCPTTIDVDGLHADAHAALSAVERVCERVGLNKVKGNDGVIVS